MSDVGGHDWEFRFALQHPFRQPLEPFRPSVTFVLLAQVFDIWPELFPGKHDWPAEKIIHDIERQLVVKNKHADTFPCASQVRDDVLAIGTEDFLNLLPARVVWQFDDPPERLRKSGTLKRAHETQHRFAAPLPPVIADLCRGEDDARRYGDGVDQVRESRYVHGFSADQ